MVGHFILESEMAVVFRDAYPVNPGHVHIAPRQHVADFFDLSGLERDAMLDMLDDVREWLDDEFSPDGYNVGLNIGEAAGQTVPHAHLHVIPRYDGAETRPQGVRSVRAGEGADYKRRSGNSCGFCEEIKSNKVALADGDVVVLEDAFPVARGHCHVVPRRHEPNFFALAGDERDQIWDMVERVRHQLDADLSPDGYNIGLNAGTAAGQSVPHANLHVIPRWLGDVDDPRGGVRWVEPARAPYWTGRVVDDAS
jgi:diadenosine tetraphosphate (Ap4A) HIT family hydrolase